MAELSRYNSCARCREDKDGLIKLKKIFEDVGTSSADIVSYLQQSPMRADMIQDFFALPATDKNVVQYFYKTGLAKLICTDCFAFIKYTRSDFIYIHAFNASLNVGDLDSQTYKTISTALCAEAKETLEEFRSNEWYVSFPLAQILNDPDSFHEFASAPEYQEVDRKRLRNTLSRLLKFEGHWDDDEECQSGDAGVAIFDNVKSALAVLDKPTRKVKAKKPTVNVKHKTTPAVIDEFTRLATSKSVDDRRAAASDLNIPLKWLKDLSQDKSADVRHSVAANPKATQELLRVLARDRSEYVVIQVAGNPGCPVDLMESLAKNKSEDVRYYLACNERAPAKTLRLLAKDDSVSVRAAVGRHEKTPATLLMTLACDSDENVRQGVALNPKAPIELLEALSSDEGETGSIIRWSVASNPSTPLRILRRLWRDSDEYVRQCVAGNISISKGFLLEILDEAQKLKSNRVTFVSEIAGNPKTPVEVLVALSKDKDKWVRRVVAQNTRTPKENLRLLAKERLPKEEFSGSNVRAAVASNPMCPADLLESLSRDKSAEIRRSVAQNPSARTEVLEWLAQDIDEDVRGIVAVNESATPEIRASARAFRFTISN
ncbi:MAG: hypothetical protein EBU96_07400 [Actinobacteria bacterium]|nr:hypothetical protein [Actinomycetota bacterium]